jgi:hypothetical protein
LLATTEAEANLGIWDGCVSHEDINDAVRVAPKEILFGEQTRLPYFPEDRRLPKLHSGEPLVLQFWKVLEKIPESLREALVDLPISITLTRTGNLPYFRDFRCHQAVHIGRRRRTIYLSEELLHEAAAKGYDHWAVAEGVIFAAWTLFDYMLLVEVLKSYIAVLSDLPNYRLGEPLVLKLVGEHNRHRRDSIDSGRSELGEFVNGYKQQLLRVSPAAAAQADPFELARTVFDPDLEEKWSRGKMERIAKIFNYPRIFLFDRDIIHAVARKTAERKGQETAPQSFADVLHDYEDALRFDPQPLMTAFCKGVVPKPRAEFLQKVVSLGPEALRGFFIAYKDGDESVAQLMHPLWIYLCTLSSDPAGVFSRAGRCRALVREGSGEGMDRPLAGLFVRLDKADNYEELSNELMSMGAPAREEIVELIQQQKLQEEDEWEVFKGRKQGIVTRAYELLEVLSGGSGQAAAARKRRAELHQDPRVIKLLANSPHRLTSDPSGVLMYLRSYQRSLKQFGPTDPDTDLLLACVLIRLDQAEDYEGLIELIHSMGTPAFSALYSVLENIPERDQKRREILVQARILWSKMVAETRLLSNAGPRMAFG